MALYRPLNTGLRFSMKARRPSLKSSLSKQASAIFSSLAWSCCDSGLAISRAEALASAMVSGAFWAIAPVMLVDHGVELGVGRDAVHQAHLVGFLRGILLGGEQELHGARQADDARQPLDAQEAVAEPELGRRHAEARALVAVAQVAAGREVHAAADAVAGDLGDGRLGEIVERLVAFLGDRVVADLRLGVGALALELGDVGARDEGLAAGAAHHHAADLGIRRRSPSGRRRSSSHMSSETALSLAGLLKTTWPTAPSRLSEELLFLHAD